MSKGDNSMKWLKKLKSISMKVIFSRLFSRKDSRFLFQEINLCYTGHCAWLIPRPICFSWILLSLLLLVHHRKYLYGFRIRKYNCCQLPEQDQGAGTERRILPL